MTISLASQFHSIEFEHVSLSYGNRAVISDLSFSVNKGEIVCVIGPSGCGKTTALRMAGGLVRPDSGNVKVLSQRLDGPRRDVAIVFQDYGKALLPWRTARGNVSLALEATGVPERQREEQIMSLLAKVGLASHADRYPTEMSGGMQQRLQIARCLAQKPDVILMDEPFGALDAMTRQSLQDEMLSIVSETGATVFFVTHDIEEAIYLGDKVIGLLPNPGRIGQVFDIPLPRPRSQLATRELPEFLKLRRELFAFIEKAER
jgi:NitT/TauT family transport system ATP-binding protein